MGESMGVASVCLLRRYIDFLILLIPIYSSCICSFLQHPYFLFILLKCFFVLVYVNFVQFFNKELLVIIRIFW